MSPVSVPCEISDHQDSTDEEFTYCGNFKRREMRGGVQVMAVYHADVTAPLVLIISLSQHEPSYVNSYRLHLAFRVIFL